MIKPRLHLSSNVTYFSHFKSKSSHLSFPLEYTPYLSYTHQHHHIPPVSNLSRKKDPVSFAAALSYCSNTQSSVLGNQIHAQIIKLGLSSDMFTQNNLLVMYSRCEVLDDALTVFETMTDRNLVSWTSMISGFVRNGEFGMGLQLYLEMTRSGFHPNEFTIASVISACTALEDIKFGSSLYSVAFKIGLDANSFVGSSLLCMYAKCKNIEAAEHVFECIKYRDVACWNAMVGGYALNGYGYDAMRIVSFMHRKGLIADQFTFLNAIKGCLINGDLNYGRQIHALVIHNEMEFSTALMNSFTDMYFRTGMKDWAVKVFSKIGEKDNVSWNTVISGFAQEENEREVVALFSEMLLTGLKPNHVTFSIIFRLCGVKDNLSLGLQFGCFAYHLGLFDDVLVVSSLVNMFSNCGEMEKASFLFSSHHTRSIIARNEMIVGYNLNGLDIEALELFCSLHESGTIADEFTYSSILAACHGTQLQKTGEQIHASIIKSGFSSCSFVCSSLVNAYAQFGLVGCSFKIFQDIEVLDLVSWGVMISAFTKQGFSCEALSLINCLREAWEKLDEFILGSALNACANIAAFNQCKCFHSHLIKTGYEEHLYVASAVIDAYAKCGDISSSKQAFDQCSRNDDSILFNTMITAYAHHGLIEEAIDLFGRMKLANLDPTHATFVAVILACSHLGLVEQGQGFFDSISSEYGMYPSMDNFACLVDLLARNGFLEKAKDVIEHMPFEPWPAIWRSLLSGCRIHGNKEMGVLAAEQILKLMPGNDAAYVLLSNVYSEDGRWEDAGKVRMRMEEEGVQKVSGYSRIEI